MREAQNAILVTGGAGYIGSHAVWELLDKGEQVVVLDDLSAGPQVGSLGSAAVIRGDIADQGLVGELIQKYGVNTILHFAGFIRVEESVREPEKYFNNNTEKTGALLAAASENGVSNIIYSSTAAVYGSPEKSPVDENAPTKPVSPYGESKLMAEKIVADSGMKFVVLRYFNVAGADPKGRTGYRIEEHPSHLIRSAIRALLDGTTLQVFGTDYPTPDGTCVRDYIHVSDLARAHTDALEYLRKGNTSRIFNCGNGRGFSVKEVVSAFNRVTGNELKVEYGPRRAGDPATLIADPTRIMKEFAWKPEYTELDTIIKHELAWVRSQRQD